jgi:hypothetical protein
MQRLCAARRTSAVHGERTAGAAGGPDARQAGLASFSRISERTLERLAAAWRRDGIAGLIDRRQVRVTGAHPSVDERVAELALDTTVLPVQVRDGVFGDPVSVHVTLALDVYTRSLVGFRLTLVSDTSMDVAMLLREVMMPTRMRDGWGPELSWAYPGIPAALVEQLSGYPVAGLPARPRTGHRHRRRVNGRQLAWTTSANYHGQSHPGRLSLPRHERRFPGGSGVVLPVARNPARCRLDG